MIINQKKDLKIYFISAGFDSNSFRNGSIYEDYRDFLEKELNCSSDYKPLENAYLSSSAPSFSRIKDIFGK